MSFSRSVKKAAMTFLMFFLSGTLVSAHTIPMNAHRDVVLRQHLSKTDMSSTRLIIPSMTWTVTPIAPFPLSNNDNVMIQGYNRININLYEPDPTLFGYLTNGQLSPYAHFNFKTFVNWIYNHFNTESVAQYPWLPGVYSPLLADAKGLNAWIQTKPVLNSDSQSIPIGINSLTSLAPDISTDSFNISFTVPIFRCKAGVEGNVKNTSRFRNLLTAEHLSLQLAYGVFFLVLAIAAGFVSYVITLNGNSKNSVAASAMASFVQTLVGGSGAAAYLAPTDPIAWFFVFAGALGGAYRVVRVNVHKDAVIQREALLELQRRAAQADAFGAADDVLINLPPDPYAETFCRGSSSSGANGDVGTLCQEAVGDWFTAERDGWSPDSNGNSPAGSCGDFLPGPPANSALDLFFGSVREPGPSNQYPGNNVTNPFEPPGPTPSITPHTYSTQRLLVHR